MDKKAACKIAKDYVSFLLKQSDLIIVKAYLFGSYAKGRFHEDSDIDLAIILRNLKDDFEMQVKLMILRRDFDLSIEPHPFDEKDFDDTNPFAYEIMKTGIKIL